MPDSQGIVTFIGAGPGDPELLTLKARRLIAEADVVIYAGSLVNAEVLAHARPDAALHDSAGMPLDEQIEVMVAAAAQGQRVARLHTGDPAIYGATFEQMRRLAAAGVPYRVVPGVSSAFAAAAALGVELTVPGGTQTVIFSRLAGRTPVPDSEALADLAAHRSSMVLFLSAGMVGRVVEVLREAGYAEETPIAVAFRVTWPDERIVRGTLADIAGKVEAAEVTHHALIVVSPALDTAATADAPDSHLYGAAFDAPQPAESTAIVTLTRGGTATGRRLVGSLPGAVLYAPARFAAPDGKTVPTAESVRQVLQSAFEGHRSLVCIMAAGIVVRELAPLLRSKHSDPAVVVVDEAGRHAVSLLSGHRGGANALAQQVAAALGGEAVLTTASDVQGLPALDLLGERAGWALEGGDHLTALQAALVNGDPIGVVQHAGDESWRPDPAPPNLWRYESFDALAAALHTDHAPQAALLITPYLAPGELLAAIPATVVYRPRCLAVGVGCNRGTPAEEIAAAVAETLAVEGLSPESIACVATVDAKADEAGLLAACEARGWPLRIFSRAQIAALGELPNPSEHAQRALGVPGVAEPAAMLAAKSHTLLAEKRKYPNVTVALALLEGEA